MCAIALSVTLLCDAVSEEAAEWTIYVANDNCPDYTWGLTEDETRQAFADIVKGHLDEMRRTDSQPPENRDRYNMAVTQEALCFVERYPDRKDELVQRIKEGRVYVSPYLCNSLWALQSAEGAIRTFYPYRRLERQWGIATDCAHHIELPSLPWGVPTILAGCGFRSLSVPFLSYDSTFGNLKNPPLFYHEGPDGSRVQVVLDPWACSRAHYTQGARLLKEPQRIDAEWLPHYDGLGDDYPLRAILASGTHGDISPRSGSQARGFAAAIIGYNARAGSHAKLVNATFPQFWQAVDESQRKTPFLKTFRGSLGHSWDLWPVCLAKYVADMRRGERTFLAAESLVAVVSHRFPELHDETRSDRQRAEWCWAMLSDHAWNGTNETNKRHNAELRRKWSAELCALGQRLIEQAWTKAGLESGTENVTLFNSLSWPRKGLVAAEVPPGVTGIADQGRPIPSQVIGEADRRLLCFVSPEVPAFGFRHLQLTEQLGSTGAGVRLRATDTEIESPSYSIIVDPATGGISSLIHKATGAELAVAKGGRGLCQTVYLDGKEHTLTDVTSEATALGPVLARLRIRGAAAGITVTNFVTVFADLDRVDFDVRIHKPVSTERQRLCHVFPVLREGDTLRVATAGAVVRPRPQPAGDLLPGADTRRFAIGEFLSTAGDDLAVTIVPLDSFALRLDLDSVSIEALGNDQNYREVLRDQDGVADFRFRYSLQARAGGYDQPDAVAFSRQVAAPLLVAMGQVEKQHGFWPRVSIDPSRAVATCFKPVDDDSGGTCLRIWEVAGQSGPVSIRLSGYNHAEETDLLERVGKRLPILDGTARVDLKPNGYAAVRLGR
jgi:hypothetical protein